jgi:hypothetical protein
LRLGTQQRVLSLLARSHADEWSDNFDMAVVVALVLCAVLGGGQAKTHGKESVRVYVFATEVPAGSPPGDALQGRLAAVRELRDALRRKSGLSVVDDRAQADGTVEVIDREQTNAGEGGFGGVKLTPLVNTIIRVRIIFGERQGELKGMAPGAGSRAAKDAADGLSKWIERNRPSP